MTPPASAAASQARRSVSRSSPRSGASRRPRRISGPAAAVALPAPGIALPRERPSTRPQRRSAPTRRTRTRSTETPGIALRAIDKFNDIAHSELLDRLLRGRLWIGLLAFALIGIVAMQLLVLELNTKVGRSLRREAQLERSIAQAGIEDSMASAGDRVEPTAAATGMTIAAPGTLHFVIASTADIARAAAALSTSPSSDVQGSTGLQAATGSSATTGESSNTGTQTTATSSEASNSSGESSGESGGGSGSAPSETSAANVAASNSSESSPGGGASSTATTPATTSSNEASAGSSTIAGVTGGATQAGTQE